MDDTLLQLEADARKLVEDYVTNSPYKLNPDSKHVGKIIKSLAKRKLKNGFFYCPCRMLSDDKETDAKIICPVRIPQRGDRERRRMLLRSIYELRL